MRSTSDLIVDAFNTSDLRKSLKAAHFSVTGEKYLQFSVIATLLAALLFLGATVLMLVFGIEVVIIPFLPFAASQAVVFLLLVFVIFGGLYIYPALVAEGRKAAINIDLPFALTYMQALSTTVTLFHVFRGIYEHDDLYGEVSRECGMIVRDVEVFGDDLLTAMRNLQQYTPSDNFRDLLNDLALVFKSGGSITDFFASRNAHYRERAQQEMEMTLKTMEVMAEVYVTAFVAGPIAMIIMLVAQNMSGQSNMDFLMPIMYIGLPVGAMVMIAILHILMPFDHLKISRKEISDTEYHDVAVRGEEGGQLDLSFVKKIQEKKQLMKFTGIVRHPVKFFISDYEYGLILGGFLSCVIALLYLNGTFAMLFPEYTLEVLIALLIIAFMLPVSAAYELRKLYLNQVEAQLPELLREISDMKDLGMTLQGAIHLISQSKLGVLSSELTIVSRDMQLGASVSNALVRMEERIGLVSVKRAISLVVRASEITDYLKEILAIAVGDLEHYLKMKYDRFSVSFIYVAIVYLSFGIFLYSAYQLNVSFIASFENFNLDFDMAGNITDMFHIAIILGTFSGIMAGQLSTSSILSGFKHSIIFLVASVLLFIVII
jgi:flagellar protein FlaJ